MNASGSMPSCSTRSPKRSDRCQWSEPMAPPLGTSTSGSAAPRRNRRRRRHGTTAQRRLQLRDQLVAARGRDFTPLGDRRDEPRDVVLTREQQADELAAQAHFALAQPVENVLNDVREAHHLVEAEQALEPFDGVRAAKQRVEVVVAVLPFSARSRISSICASRSPASSMNVPSAWARTSDALFSTVRPPAASA